ncbi:hypothetical protein [Nocardiopsis alba]|uniref:hypothetical protein n=1 Tax=Nocardiopsis alba TaxID=53437 RepID=UPI003D749D37
MHIPSRDEIADKIEQLGLDPCDPSSPAQAANAILAGRAGLDQPSGRVLSRSTVAVSDGYLEITVTHYEGTAP